MFEFATVLIQACSDHATAVSGAGAGAATLLASLMLWRRAVASSQRRVSSMQDGDPLDWIGGEAYVWVEGLHGQEGQAEDGAVFREPSPGQDC